MASEDPALDGEVQHYDEHGISGFGDHEAYARDPSMTPPRFHRPDPEESVRKDEGEVEDERPVGYVDELTTTKTGNNIEVVNRVVYGEEKPTVSTFKDHFTLPVPSSVVRYRNSRGAARVIEGTDFQFVLEEHVDPKDLRHEVTIRRIADGGSGLTFLRCVYTVVTAFWAGFLFVFSMQCLLFLFLHLAITLGITEKESNVRWFSAIGAVFAIIPLVYGLATGMVLGSAFVGDTWRGHLLIQNFTLRNYSKAIVEWIFFAFYLGLPTLIACFTMLAQSDDWWSITGTFWVGSIAFFFVLFTVNVIVYEARACEEVMRNISNEDSDDFLSVLKRCIMLRQKTAYSGQMTRSYLSRGSIEDAEHTDKSADNMISQTIRERSTWRASINQVFVRFGWFEDISDEEKIERFFSVDDARDVRPFITSHTWSLEKIFCRPRNSRYIAIIRGAGAVTRAQMKSSLLCSFLGSFLILFLFLSVLVYLQAGVPATMFMVAFAIVVSWPNFKSTYRLYSVAKDIVFARTQVKASEGSADRGVEAEEVAYQTERDLPTYTSTERVAFKLPETDSEGLYLVDEMYRVSRPTERTAWVLFWCEVTFLFLWPTISLFAVGNWPLGILYGGIVGVTGFRYYFNPASAMEEVGNMDFVDGKTERDLWQNQSRLNDIVGSISRGKSRTAWVLVISFFAFCFLALSAGAVGDNSTTAEIEDPTYHYMQGYEYLPLENSLRYPTCHMTSDLQESPLTAMADYIFLARVAYRGNITQSELDNWFGQQVAVDQAELVSVYREQNNIDSAVVFKLITYPTSTGKDFAFLAIRGTTNEWEALTDAQLWSGAMLMQTLREFLPFGVIWSPVMTSFIKAAVSVQSSSIDEISFYKDTVQFAKYLKQHTYAGVAVTGHSLGGGLSMITGAQAHVPSVALSGPNTVLTRRSLDPPISIEELDRYTFNIIPERDVVPMIDDTAQNYQQIRCNADFTDVIGCHDTTRALCEAIYTCGSNGRPVPCECVTQMGFPHPEQMDGTELTFAEACNITTSN